jgi:mycothiol system anti-sigma-R factor
MGEQRDVCGCDDVLRDVWLFLDDEMNPDRRAAVQQHIDDCSPCLEEAGLDAKLKSLLHRKCGGDKAPEQLKSRLLAALHEVTIEQVVTAVAADGRRITTTTVTSAQVVATRVDPAG